MSAATKRPFYIIGHNPNTLGAVEDALRRGANAIEPDLNRAVGGGPLDGQLCLSHDTPFWGTPGYKVGDPMPTLLEPFLKGVKALLKRYPQLSMVMFDSKLDDAASGKALHDAVNKYLLPGTSLSIIYSVGYFNMVKFFDDFHESLGPQEALMVDDDDDPVKIENYFTKLQVKNICYGDGNFVASANLDWRPAVEQGVMLKARYGQIKWAYTWTIGAEATMREMIRVGVDGMIINDVEALVEVVKEHEFAFAIRPATPADNPFVVSGPAYGLVVATDARSMAGTDANVTIALHGDKGSATKVVTGNLIKRFEAGDDNYVSFLGADIGAPQSVSVAIDDSGNAPQWFLDTISVVGREHPRPLWATFDQWILPGAAAVTRPFEPARYSIKCETANIGSAGTDVNVTFAFRGAKATASGTVNGDESGRFEAGRTDSVSIVGAEVGVAQSLTILTDDQGNAPGWFLTTATVTEEGSASPQTFWFNQWIYPGIPVTRTPVHEAYTLTVKTTDESGGGTDANVTFTLHGTLGSVSQTVDGQPDGWFEDGDVNAVVIKGMDIGSLQKLTVSHDDQGNGPDWSLASIAVKRPGVPVRIFTFNRVITAGTSVTV